MKTVIFNGDRVPFIRIPNGNAFIVGYNIPTFGSSIDIFKSLQ